MGRAREVARRARARAASWASRAGGVALLVVFGLLFIEPMWLLRADFGSDDASYFSHAATVALDADLDYSNEPVVAWAQGRRIAIGSPGAGWLAAPFVAAFSIVDRVRGHPVIQDHARYTHSWSLFGFFVASLFFFVLGVWLYRRAIEAVWPGLDPRVNLLLALGTGVPFYVLRRFTMSHAFEFAACALGFWAAARLYRALALGERTRPWILWSAVAAAVNLAVRVNNLNTLILAHVVLLLLFVFGGPGVPRVAWPPVRRALLRVTGAIAVALVPLALFNLAVYGAAYPTPARMYGEPVAGTASRGALEILAHGLTLVPNLVPLIFSSEFGILYTNPVLVLGGVFLLLATTRKLAAERDVPHALALLGVLAFFGLSTAIVLWWQTTGTSYGYRYLFPLYPVALAGLLIGARGARRVGGGRALPGGDARMAGRRGTPLGSRLRRALMPAAIALSAVSVVSQTLFSATPALEVRPQVNVFGVHHSASAKGYLTRLPEEIIEPFTWVSLAARRLPGFYVSSYVTGSSIRDRVPEDWLESAERLYDDTPVDVYIQLTLALLLWVAGGWWLIRPRRAGRAAARVEGEVPADPVAPSAMVTNA